VDGEESVSAKKESSVEDFGSRERVGIGVQEGSERSFAHHGMRLKCFIESARTFSSF